MYRQWISLTVLILLTADSTGLACGDSLKQAAISLARDNGQNSSELEAQLRAAGPDGVAAMTAVRQRLVTHVASLQRPDTAGDVLQRATERLARFDAAMDRVGGARYCSRSGLYWHTDFESAQAAARKSGKPILSLRLLGNLTDEYSCANSRFFRTTLYANEEVSRLLRDNFVLHWKSVRPVPVVTIDFGDGRKLQRTLTGNSIHYVLTSNLEVVEALPGLYGPKAFQSQLKDSLEAVRQMSEMDSQQRSEAIAQYHREKLLRLEAAWTTDLARVNRNALLSDLPPRELSLSQPVPAKGSATPPPAAAAARIAMPKAKLELPVIAHVTAERQDPATLEDEKIWGAIAALHAEEAQLDLASRALIESENPTAAQAGQLAVTKRVVESPLVRMVRSFQSAIALDTVKNEYQLHRTIHQWLSQADYRPGVDALNDRVYAQLFLTPRNDPWLGLAPADAYTALPNGGVTQTTATATNAP